MRKAKAKKSNLAAKLAYPLFFLVAFLYLWNQYALLPAFATGILGVAGTAWGWASE